MKYPVYAIRDVHTGFMPPTVDRNDNSAMRNFVHAARNPESLFNSHPQDYALFKIGEYETDTGEIVPCLPVEICSGVSIGL